jgi:hypothetical protein
VQSKEKTPRIRIFGRPLTKGCAGALYLENTDGILKHHSLDELDILLYEPGRSLKRGLDFREASISISIKGQDESMRLFQGDIAHITKALHLIKHGYSIDITPLLRPIALEPKYQLAHEEGRYIKDEGFYLGLWEPRLANGMSLCKLFDVYAAPRDIMKSDHARQKLTYEAAINFCASAKNWHGQHGIFIQDEEELLHYIEHNPDELDGKWFIPPICLLAKSSLYEGQHYYTYLERFYNSGELGQTFCEKDTLAQYYWSCSKTDDSEDNSRQTISIKKKSQPDYHDTSTQLSARPIRLKQRKID